MQNQTYRTINSGQSQQQQQLAPINSTVQQTRPRPSIEIPQANHAFNDPDLHAAVNNFATPFSINFSVASAAGVGAIDTLVFVLNNDLFAPTTDNGSGAGTITYAFPDGNGGNTISALLYLSRANLGLICYGYSLRMNVTAGGAGDPVGLNNANAQFRQFTAYNTSQPLNSTMSTNQTRSDFDTSIDVIPVLINFSRLTQFGLVIPPGDTATVTLYFQPNYKG